MQFEAPDARADDAKRTVSVTRDLVVIARRRQGVTMRIALSPKAFAGVRLAPGRGGGYEVSLAHADPELSVALACSSDEGRNDPARAAPARAPPRRRRRAATAFSRPAQARAPRNHRPGCTPARIVRRLARGRMYRPKR